jgi:hypothetical protein
MNQGYFKKEEKREEEKREKSFRGEGLFIKSPSPRTPLFKNYIGMRLKQPHPYFL